MSKDRPDRDQLESAQACLITPAAGWMVRDIVELLAEAPLPVVRVELVDGPASALRPPLQWELLAELLCEV